MSQDQTTQLVYVQESLASGLHHATIGSGGGILRHGQCALEECAALVGDRPVTLIISGLMATVTEVDVPARNRAQLVQAAPYAIEDRVANDIETLHVALGAWTRGEPVATACVDRDWLKGVLDAFAEAGVTVRAALVASTLVPAGVSGVQVPDGLLVNEGGDHYALPREVLESLSSDLAESSMRVAADDCGWVLEPAGICRETFFEALVEVVQAGGGIDLLQGEFATARAASGHSGWWRRVAMLAAAVVIINFVVTGIEVWQLSQRAAAARAGIDAAFAEAFPDQRAVRPVLQMQQQLAALRISGGRAGGFLGLLRGAGQAIARNPRVRVESVDFRNDTLELALTASSIADLDDLATRIEETTGFPVELQSTTSGPDGVRGRVQIGGDAS